MTTTTNPAPDKVVQGVCPSPDELYFLEAWPRQIEASVGRATDALNRLVTLGSALAGGSLVALKDDVCTGWARVGAATCFFLALTLAVIGSRLVNIPVAYHPEAVCRSMIDAAKVKGWWGGKATWAMVAGFAVAVMGAVARLAGW